MNIRQAWRDEVRSEVQAIAERLETLERDWAWLAKKVKERGVNISRMTIYNYANGRSMASEEFISVAFDILGIETKRKAG